MNYFIQETIYHHFDKENNRTKRKKQLSKLPKLLWDEYLATTLLTPKNLRDLLKKIRRQKQKKKSASRQRDGIYVNSTPQLLPAKDKCITVETIVQKTFKTTPDGLSLDDSNLDLITSTHLLFRCPVCCEDDKLVDVILQCRHCLCRSCHEMMIEMDKKLYFCPVCRKDMSFLERHKGPILHNS